MQLRWPWVMRPLEVLDALSSPRRWLCRLRPGGDSRHSAGVDSTRAAEALNRVLGRLSPARDRLLSRSRLLATVEWKVRKLVWSVLWGSVVC
ncbi:MAG TPA: hypothetical protein VG078_07800 [Acidimicrobiales bacterium]|nr:hypothetical protein [Acidimicrobiales bacterium]